MYDVENGSVLEQKMKYRSIFLAPEKAGRPSERDVIAD
jgi:hypothetical protein